jgi:hypothetical protein
MGEEISIVELAERLIRQRGLRVGKDIEIVFTGCRPGEKLREELTLQSEVALPTPHPKVQILAEPPRSPLQMATIAHGLSRLGEIALIGDPEELRPLLFAIVAEADGGEPSRFAVAVKTHSTDSGQTAEHAVPLPNVIPMPFALHLEERHREAADDLSQRQRDAQSQAS